jgi:hypothetical protein
LGIYLFTLNASAWDFGLKGNYQFSRTDNVNSTATAKIKDKFTTANLAAQVKNKKIKLRIKGKLEKYKKQTDNDYYSADVNLQYKFTKDLDFNLGAFKLVYNNIPAISSDTSSNNSGARLSVNYNIQHDNQNSTLLSLTATQKNYPVLVRKDKIVTALIGFEYLPNEMFTVSPDFSLNSNSSDDDYYKNYSYGPSLYLGFIPSDSWEFSLNLSYTHTKYSGRPITSTVKGRAVNVDEYQGLVTTEVGTIYNLTQNLSLQGKYSTSKNNSNNSSSAYVTNLFSGNIGFRF